MVKKKSPNDTMLGIRISSKKKSIIDTFFKEHSDLDKRGTIEEIILEGIKTIEAQELQGAE